MRTLLILILLLLISSCGKNKVVGTTDETEIVGTVVFTNGNAAPNATLELFSKASSSKTPLQKTESNENGRFIFKGVNVGNYRVFASLVHEEESLTTIFENVKVNENGAHVDLGINTLSLGGSIHGQLLYENTTFAKEITAFIPGTSYLAISDSLGLFTISNVPPSTYRLAFLGGGLVDTMTDDFIVQYSDTTKLGIITVRKVDTLIVRDIYGSFNENEDQVHTITAEIYGDSVTIEENLPQELSWNPISKGFSGYVTMPAKGDSFTVTIKVYDNAQRVTGLYVLPFSNMSGNLLIPSFNPLNATPHILTKNIITVWKNTPFTLPITAIDSFSGSCEKYQWDTNNDGIIDDSATSNTEITLEFPDTGTHFVRIQVLDNDMNWSQKTISIVVPDAKPKIRFNSPARDTLIWDTLYPLPFDINFSDDFGGKILERVLSINGKKELFDKDIKYEDQLTIGMNEIIATCSDDDGNSISDTVHVRLEFIDEISAGNGNSFFISKDTKLWAAGDNYYGKLGLGDKKYHEGFKQVVSGASKVSAGEWHTGYIGTYNGLYLWGSNDQGQLGIGTEGLSAHETAPNFILDNVKQTAPGMDFTLLLTMDGTLYATGRNENTGVFGIGHFEGSLTPTFIRDEVKAIAVGASHSMVLIEDGTLLTSGYNSTGQLGNGKSGKHEQENTFQKIMSDVAFIEAGQTHSMAIDNKGTLWAWGENRMGQLGNGKSGNGEISPLPVEIMGGVASVSCGTQHTLILKTNGTLWVCGSNSSGQLGTGDRQDTNTPKQVLTSVKSISAGFSHSLIVLNSGEILGCGSNEDGGLGLNVGDNCTVFSSLIL